MHTVGTVEIAYVSDPRLKYAAQAGSEGGELAPDDDPRRAFLDEEHALLSVVAERVGNLLSRSVVAEKIATMTDKLAVCSVCSRVRDAGCWKSVLQFLEERTGTTFAKALCPACTEALITHHSDADGEADASSPHNTKPRS